MLARKHEVGIYVPGHARACRRPHIENIHTDNHFPAQFLTQRPHPLIHASAHPHPNSQSRTNVSAAHILKDASSASI